VVTCPTVRIHPAIIVQAAATSAVMHHGRFQPGVAGGETLNDHILGDRWPQDDVRLEMLEEAVELIRLLWQGGERSHHGRHYSVENARLEDLPDEPPPVLVSGLRRQGDPARGEDRRRPGEELLEPM
jgi:G6PDH family F420-dependent oxidoreductase